VHVGEWDVTTRTVEALLACHLQAELARKRAADDTLAHVVTILNAFHERHGFMSDEFSDFSPSRA